MKPRPCTSHCRGCNRHSAGCEAFDRHRRGAFAGSDGGNGERICLHPAEVVDEDGKPWYEEVPGTCRISGGEVLESITVWRRRGSADRFKGRGRGKPERPSGARALAQDEAVAA